MYTSSYCTRCAGSTTCTRGSPNSRWSTATTMPLASASARPSRCLRLLLPPAKWEHWLRHVWVGRLIRFAAAFNVRETGGGYSRRINLWWRKSWTVQFWTRIDGVCLTCRKQDSITRTSKVEDARIKRIITNHRRFDDWICLVSTIERLTRTSSRTVWCGSKTFWKIRLSAKYCVLNLSLLWRGGTRMNYLASSSWWLIHF